MNAKEREEQGLRSTDRATGSSHPEETGRDWGLILFLSSILVGLLAGLWWLVKATFR